MNLTKEQSKPVNSSCKINVCLACPGSGKTTVLVARAEKLWRDTREPILVVTFSNDACSNINKRILPEAKAGITVKTIHSLCYDIVKTYWRELNEILGGDVWPAQPRLITKEEELGIIKELFKEDNATALYDIFTYMRSLGTSPESILNLFKKKVYFDRVRQQDIQKLIEFERVRKSRGLITFDDMVDLAESLIPLPFVATELSRKYQHLLIDEAQDTSDQQWKVLRPIVLSCSTSLVVGDYNQSIYGWRSADGSILLNMSQMKESVTFRLSKSFRSGSLIAHLANKICYDKSSQIVPQDHLGSVKVSKFSKVEDEVKWVLKNSDTDTAIVSRTNNYLEKFERECIEQDKPYMGKSFYRSEHIADLYKFITDYSGSDIVPIIKKAYINNASYSSNQVDDFRLVLSIIDKEGLDKFLELVEDSRKLESPGVTLTTGHSSKGLEWKKVFVIGCHTGHVPHKYSTDEREEKNLLYVMTSLAAEDLIITCVGEPSIYLPAEVRKEAELVC